MKVIFRNLFVIGSSSLIQALAVFAKGVLLARILGVHEFGFAVIIIAVTGALDIFADAGIDRFIVQSRFGHRTDVVSTSHTFRVVGSVIVGCLIALISVPLAQIFHSPSLWAPIAATGGIVGIRGFVNLDYKLQQRNHRFEKETLIDTSRFIVDLSIAITMAAITHSYIAVIYGSYGNALTQLLLSHLLSTGRYSFAPKAKLVQLVGRFSVPIYINATMLFAAMQGDRMVVAGVYSKREVALYAVACTLGQGATTLIGKIIERILLPIFSPRGQSELSMRKTVSSFGAIVIIGSFLFQLSICIFAPFLTRIIYGSAYTRLNGIIYAAAIFQTTQIQQAWVNAVLFSNGLTKPLPRITFMRSAAFPAAIMFAYLGMNIISIPIAFGLGAELSLGVSFYSARRLNLINKWLIIAPSFGFILSMTTVVYGSIQHFW
jgi:O-antigen/teichoic acid export membrane protein